MYCEGWKIVGVADSNLTNIVALPTNNWVAQTMGNAWWLILQNLMSYSCNLFNVGASELPTSTQPLQLQQPQETWLAAIKII